MGYEVYTVEQITPRRVERPGILAPEIVENPQQAQLPHGAVIAYQPPGYSRFADDPADRTLLLVTAAGKASGAEIFATFPSIREEKEAEIRAEGGRRLKALDAPYGPEERESWATQQREARSRLVDPYAVTPMINAMATARGITVQQMTDKIMENVALFEAAAGQILGQQQALIDRINAATDYDAMLAISW